MDSNQNEVEGGTSCRLSGINVVRKTGGWWQIELTSIDISSEWFLEGPFRHKAECIKKAEEFSWFSGLPMFVLGQEWIATRTFDDMWFDAEEGE